jgi:hypothetical protein
MKRHREIVSAARGRGTFPAPHCGARVAEKSPTEQFQGSPASLIHAVVGVAAMRNCGAREHSDFLFLRCSKISGTTFGIVSYLPNFTCLDFMRSKLLIG